MWSYHIHSFEYNRHGRVFSQSFVTDKKYDRIKLELPLSPSSHSIVVFFPVGLLSLSRHFQQVLLGVEVFSISWPTRPVEKVVITTKGLQEKTTIEWEDGEKGNFNLILTEIFPSVRETWHLKVLIKKYYYMQSWRTLRLTPVENCIFAFWY